jgi:hypothetical protein
MATFIPANNTLEVEFRYNWRSQQVEDRIRFEKSDGWNEDDAATLGAALVDWYGATLRHLQCTDITLNELQMTNLETEDGFSITYNTGLPLAGLVAEESCTNNVTLCCSLRSANRGRSARGRIYPPGLRKTQISGNTWDADYAELLRGYLEQLTTADVVGEGINLVITSYQHNNAPRVAAVNYQVLAVSLVDLTVDSQRRRLPGRGR